MTIPDPQTPASVTDYVLSVLASSAHTPYIGEPISQLQHSLQCAHLAASSSSPDPDPETIIAALLHDIGQFAPEADLQHLTAHHGAAAAAVQNMGRDQSQSVGRVGHETLGARLLSALGFPAKVARLVESHVAAKRYLCAVEAGYHAALSDASKKSLEYQGGPMGDVERAEFERSPWCGEMCRLRKWDDAAKEVGLAVPGLEEWRGMMVGVLGGVETSCSDC